MEKQNGKQFGALFSSVIERDGHMLIGAEGLGVVLGNFPVVGGGADCIVIRVGERVVRLVCQGELPGKDVEGTVWWWAEELVPRCGKEGR